MKILHFALGACFRITDMENITPEKFFETLFSALAIGDVAGMHIHGGVVSSICEEEAFYLCVFNNGSLSRMRRVYKKLSLDFNLMPKLVEKRPFLQSNAIEKLENLHFYGVIGKDGALAQGEETLLLRIKS